ncbi:MAG: hypothetical protein CVV64_13310 [Candidatus Wallbacteria bacterium HGW-Wallbacteria-1]|uniref:Uncharacterized protein n=1 Tax=Candidatus Wallbacteria bacterium HGW-Wallbacteria-1 TaxID=2013854 RepID=A0A2N1PMV5_9BACT|nr:MAG: hypothetical protein CVV64_13310 [Candidatus Wallbacteria bacterium HGW-Wallbacteria-1]
MKGKLFHLLELAAGIVLQSVCFAAFWGFSGWDMKLYMLVLLFPAGALFMAGGVAKLMGEEETTHFWHNFTLCILLPFYGAAGMLFLALFRRYLFNLNSSAVDDAYQNIQFRKTDIEEDYARSGHSEKIVRRELWVQSYFDIMRGYDKGLKKSLITKILKEWTPNGVKLLKMALEDSEYEIRSFAASGLSHIEEQMATNLASLRKSLSREPDNLDLMLTLAEAYLSYLRTGIIDQGLSQEYLRMAVTILDSIESSVQIFSRHDFTLKLLSARAAIASILGDAIEEERLWKRILQYSPDNPEALGNICAIEFRERRFASLRESCLKLSEFAHPNTPFYESVQLVVLQTQLEESGLLQTHEKINGSSLPPSIENVSSNFRIESGVSGHNDSQGVSS